MRSHDTMPVVPLARRNASAAATVLARAFHDDPMMTYLIPQPQRRHRFLPRFLGGIQRYCLRYGEVATTSDLSGVACWLRPGDTDPSPAGMLRSGVAASLALLGPAGLRRFFSLISSMERSHHEVMRDEPHWYLWLLGTEPARVRQGVASSLLGPTLARADRDGLPVYLDTHTRANVGFYGLHGFDPVSDKLANGVRYWGLRRQPGAASTSRF